MKMKLTPTHEQQAILDSFKEHRILKINAIAGSGKSSTLKMLSELNPQPSLYICYNKTTATEASNKFPKHTSCRTAHSLAYSLYGSLLQHKLNRVKGTTGAQGTQGIQGRQGTQGNQGTTGAQGTQGIYRDWETDRKSVV